MVPGVASVAMSPTGPEIEAALGRVLEERDAPDVACAWLRAADLEPWLRRMRARKLEAIRG